MVSSITEAVKNFEKRKLYKEGDDIIKKLIIYGCCHDNDRNLAIVLKKTEKGDFIVYDIKQNFGRWIASAPPDGNIWNYESFTINENNINSGKIKVINGPWERPFLILTLDESILNDLFDLGTSKLKEWYNTRIGNAHQVLENMRKKGKGIISYLRNGNSTDTPPSEVSTGNLG